MTALAQYVRLESEGRWRAPGRSEWRSVLVSFGRSSLVLSDFDEAPLTHWALAGIERVGAAGDGVRYVPDGASDEALEIADSDMIEAIAAVTAMARTRPARTRRRGPLIALLVALPLLAAAALTLPDWLRDRAYALIPDERRALLDERLLADLGTCTARPGRRALDRLAGRLGLAPGRIDVIAGARPAAARLPGGHLVVSAAVIADSRGPQALAGWLLLADSFGREDTVLRAHVHALSTPETLRFLVSGRFGSGAVAGMVARLRADPAPAATTIAAAMAAQRERDLAPAAFHAALASRYPDADPAGIDTAATDTPAPAGAASTLLDDQAWVALGAICDRRD